MIEILARYRQAIEKAINVTILNMSVYKVRPTEVPVYEEKKDLKYVIIGVSVGGAVLLLVFIILVV